MVAMLALTAAAPVAAAWLVTHDGAAIETDGEWEVRGALVVFEQSGRLASMRLSEIDVEASETRSAEPPPEPATAPAAPPPRRAPVLVLTDADVKHVRNEPAEAQGDAQEAPTAPAAKTTNQHGVEVARWKDEINVDAGTLEVTGSLANRGTTVATDTRLKVSLLDDGGKVVEERYAQVDFKAMGPGSVAKFKASFPGSPPYTSVEFTVLSRGFATRPPAGSGSR
jgi:hypothetical protein